MKKLSIEQMVIINGGISCYDVHDVMDWLWENNRAQWEFLHGSWIQCMAGTIPGQVLV
jgi:hypothetical protein